MPARAQIDDQIHVESAARAEEEGRARGLQPRAVRGDEDVRLQEIFILDAEFPQARRAGFLAGLIEHLQVEAEPAARRERRGDRAEIDGMLALVVGGAPPVEAIALARELPRIEPCAPARVLAADDIPMAVGEHGDERRVLDALGHEERAVRGPGVGEYAPGEAEPLEARADLGGEIALELGLALGILAFGGNRDAAREVGEESAFVEVPLCVGNRLRPAHRRVIISRNAAGRSTQLANSTSSE